MDSTHIEFTLVSSHDAPRTSIARLTCAKAIRRTIPIGPNLLTLPDQSFDDHETKFVPLYTPSYDNTKILFTLNYAGISQIMRSFDNTYGNCSTLSREIDDAIMLSTSRRRGVSEVKIWKVTTKVYNVDEDSENLLIDLYSPDSRPIKPPSLFGDHNPKRSTGCVICMDDYKEGSIVVKLVPCGHDFHGVCIYEWMGIKLLCPLCRTHVSQSQPSTLHLVE